ncbi:MAG: NAD(P)/FAD-dependent oxidoreductase [Sphingomonadales bacterium]|nr:NAD(P)/FAD-dependent oxidoreductase [Sphingomonadales bacterium]
MTEPNSANSNLPHFDAIVVGAGFGGLRALWELRKLGLSARVLEAGTGAGGTWYWNRYPGVRTDSEASVYCFWFDKALLQDWDWPERFPQQKDVERYFQFVVDRYDMRKDIQFETQVNSATYDEEGNYWTIGTEQGERFTCTYLIAATGLLHISKDPPFKGLSTFKGEWYKTSTWPKDPVDFTGKRVAVIGTGATGVQVIPVVAQTADHLHVFQRTPNYVVPGRSHPLEAPDQAEVKRNYDKIWKQAENHVYAFAMDPAGRSYDDVSPESRQRVLDAGWEAGGFNFLFQTFDDILLNERANETAAEFVRNKIRAIVKNPETAELLCPKNHPYAGKRPPMGQHYYETFNRENVTLVDVSKNPIDDVTSTGIRLQDGQEFEVDVIIFALGFDALTGSLMRMNVRGRKGQKLEERWAEAPQTYLGICVDGYPNLFMISGPQSPFANIPVVIEKSVSFIGKALKEAENRSHRLEAKPESVQSWGQKCQELLEMNPTILAGEKSNAWFSGANVEGKARGVYFYYGGAANYFNDLENVLEGDFSGFSR